MKKRKEKKEKLKAPVVMPEAAYNISPDDIEIGDEIITHRKIKKEKERNKEEDH